MIWLDFCPPLPVCLPESFVMAHQLYTDNGDGGISGYRTIGGTDIYDDQPATDGKGTHLYKINNTTYYAFTWKVTLTYTWGADTSPLNVFFDYSGSSMGSTDANTTDTGLRIAMIASRTVVYAGLQTAANLKGVYGTAAATDPEDVATSAMAAYEQILDLRDGKHFRFDW